MTTEQVRAVVALLAYLVEQKKLPYQLYSSIEQVAQVEVSGSFNPEDANLTSVRIDNRALSGQLRSGATIYWANHNLRVNFSGDRVSDIEADKQRYAGFYVTGNRVQFADANNNYDVQVRC